MHNPRRLSVWQQISKHIALLLLINLLITGWPGVAVAASGDGLLTYGSNTVGSTGQKNRRWTSSSYSAESAGPVSSVTPVWSVMKASPVNTGVYVQAFITTEATNNLYVYSGTTAQTSEWTATISATQYTYRAVDVAFENTSGNVLVVYTGPTTTSLYYQEGTWNGTDYDWSSGTATWTTTIGNLRWVRLANRLASNQMIAVATGDNGTNQISAKVWDGSAFGNEGGGTNGWGTINGSTDNMDAAYETNSAEGLIVWGVGATPFYKYATWTSGAWGDEQNGAALPGSSDNIIRNVALAANPLDSSNTIAFGAIEDTTTDDIQSGIWSGSAFGNTAELDAAAYSPAANKGRSIDVAYEGTTGNAILVYADVTNATVDWARSTGTAFAIQTAYDPTPTFVAEEVLSLVPDASGSNIVMLAFMDNSLDLSSFFYDNMNGGWADPGQNILELDNVSALSAVVKEDFAFAWESVYKVPTLTELLFLILVGVAVFVAVKSGVIKLKPNDDRQKDDKDMSEPGMSSRPRATSGGIPLVDSKKGFLHGGRNDNNLSLPKNHQEEPLGLRSRLRSSGATDGQAGFRRSTSSRSIDGLDHHRKDYEQ